MPLWLVLQLNMGGKTNHHQDQNRGKSGIWTHNQLILWYWGRQLYTANIGPWGDQAMNAMNLYMNYIISTYKWSSRWCRSGPEPCGFHQPGPGPWKQTTNGIVTEYVTSPDTDSIRCRCVIATNDSSTWLTGTFFHHGHSVLLTKSGIQIYQYWQEDSLWRHLTC